MIEPNPAEPILLDAVVVQLQARVHEAVIGAGGRTERRILRVEVPLAPVDPYRWLAAQTGYPRILWSSRSGDEQAACIGVAHQVRGDDTGVFRSIEKDLVATAGPRVRYYGGMAFDTTMPQPEEWSAFGAAWLVLPRFELRRHGESTTLACNIIYPDDADLRAALAADLRMDVSHHDVGLPTPLARTDLPDLPGWRRTIHAVLNDIEGGLVQKAVLARKAEIAFDAPVPGIELLRALSTTTPGCFHFLFQPDPTSGFLGASPERLFRRRGREVRSEAVAGTRPRGESRREDVRLRSELLHSDKDRREHEAVRRSIRESLDPFCDQLQMESEIGEMRLSSGRHLYSRFTGLLRDGVGTSDLIRILHPTPAVGGYPTARALELIREREPFSRGWYAGPVGWMSRDAAEFAVAIRSGLVYDHSLALFSGAGIVDGSDPVSEWLEIEQKISDFSSVLGLDRRNGSS